MKKKTKVQVWFQPGPANPNPYKSDQAVNRIRLLKNDKSYSIWTSDLFTGEYATTCCWDYKDFNNYNFGAFPTLKSKLNAMHRFDKERGWPKAVKVAEWYE